MRTLLALMALCGSFAAYADEPTEQPEEIVIVDEPSSGSDEVAGAGVHFKNSKPKRGCGCGGKGK